jgi:predicted nucleic acid-binding protein
VSVVVSDTSPLHYLILCGAEGLLPRLFERVFIPPTVFAELQQPNTPAAVHKWMQGRPSWVAIQKPSAIDATLQVDAGEREAICLAREIHAAAVLIDDRAGRAAATQCGLTVVGTLGLLEQASMRGWVVLPDALERLQRTNARLDPKLVEAMLERYRTRRGV